MLYLSIVMLLPAAAMAAVDHSTHEHHAMTVDAAGVVMNENIHTLPRDCEQLGPDYQFTIHAGRDYADNLPGIIFGMSENELRVEPCSRIELTFVNHDPVRHQWMVHGLPKYLYPLGMFHIEANGRQTKTGTFIVPSDDRNYLIHCDMAQHMEKGMRGQLVVGRGSGDLWSVPGVSSDFERPLYLPTNVLRLISLVLGAGFVLTLWVTRE